MEGYEKLAALLAADPGLSFFRRFAKLNAKNLLYLQAEIANLEAELGEIIRADKRSGHPKAKNYALCVLDLKNSTRESEPACRVQWEKFQELRKLLEEYSE